MTGFIGRLLPSPPAPAPEPLAAEPAAGEGLARVMLGYAAWKIAGWYRPAGGCSSCSPDGTYCVFHAEREALSARFRRLYDAIGEASGDELPAHTEPDHDHVGVRSHDGPFHCAH